YPSYCNLNAAVSPAIPAPITLISFTVITLSCHINYITNPSNPIKKTFTKNIYNYSIRVYKIP
ncbi:MAG: hypothetical protein ACOCUE_01030, partial [Candidatus Izemoplasmataceae bacterium]